MYAYNPDRHGLSEVRHLALEPWRLYPRGAELDVAFLEAARPAAPRVDRSTPIASIGSCFAREIKLWLQRNGYNFIETATGPCTRAGSARYDRVYNTFTLRQEFDRAVGAFDPLEKVWAFEEDGALRLLDPYRKNVAWESREEMQRELAEHAENVRRAFSEAEVLIITVGQAEIWYDKRDDSVYPLVPPTAVFDPARHGMRLSSYEENVANIDRCLEVFRSLNPGGRVILSVSPVPLRATFRPMSSIVADGASKALLRAAVDEICRRHEQLVTYFPAFEIVRDIDADAFEADNRHVRPATVDRIMALFEAWFVAEVPGAVEPARAAR